MIFLFHYYFIIAIYVNLCMNFSYCPNNVPQMDNKVFLFLFLFSLPFSPSLDPLLSLSLSLSICLPLSPPPLLWFPTTPPTMLSQPKADVTVSLPIESVHFRDYHIYSLSCDRGNVLGYSNAVMQFTTEFSISQSLH